MPLLQRFMAPPIEIFAIEAVFCALVFVMSFLIYYRAHELYRLTDYRGFHYFSNTFLFLGLAYFLRFLIFIFIYSQFGFEIEGVKPEDFRAFVIFGVAFMAYSGSASILYLIYSLSWKWNEVLRNEALLHSLALVFAVFSILHRPVSLFLIQLALLIVLLITIVFSYAKYEPERKNVIKIYPLYILIFIFWVLNLFLSFGVIPFDLRFILYTLSVVFLMIIAYRVLRKT